MLTLQDCIAFSGLTPGQLEAVADHEHLTLILAAEWAETTLDQPNGRAKVEAVLADEIVHCQRCGDSQRSRRYTADLQEFRHHA